MELKCKDDLRLIWSIDDKVFLAMLVLLGY